MSFVHFRKISLICSFQDKFCWWSDGLTNRLGLHWECNFQFCCWIYSICGVKHGINCLLFSLFIFRICWSKRKILDVFTALPSICDHFHWMLYFLFQRLFIVYWVWHCACLSNDFALSALILHDIWCRTNSEC